MRIALCFIVLLLAPLAQADLSIEIGDDQAYKIEVQKTLDIINSKLEFWGEYMDSSSGRHYEASLAYPIGAAGDQRVYFAVTYRSRQASSGVQFGLCIRPIRFHPDKAEPWFQRFWDFYISQDPESKDMIQQFIKEAVTAWKAQDES